MFNGNLLHKIILVFSPVLMPGALKIFDCLTSRKFIFDLVIVRAQMLAVEAIDNISADKVRVFGRFWKFWKFWKFWEPLGAFGRLWEALGGFGRLWEALGGFGRLWEALGLEWIGRVLWKRCVFCWVFLLGWGDGVEMFSLFVCVWMLETYVSYFWTGTRHHCVSASSF